MRGDKNKDEDSEFSDSKKRKYTEDGRAKARERFSRDESGGGGGGRGTPTSNWLPPQPPGVLAGDPKTTTRTRMRKKETVAGNWPLPVVPLAVRIYFPAGIACPKGGLVLKKTYL